MRPARRGAASPAWLPEPTDFGPAAGKQAAPLKRPIHPGGRPGGPGGGGGGKQAAAEHMRLRLPTRVRAGLCTQGLP